MKIQRSLGIALAALAAGILGTAFVGSALSASPSTVIVACAAKSNGQLRVVSSSTECNQGETALSWEEEGPQGPVGATGSPGPAGASGPAGSAGPMSTLPPAVVTKDRRLIGAVQKSIKVEKKELAIPNDDEKAEENSRDRTRATLGNLQKILDIIHSFSSEFR